MSTQASRHRPPGLAGAAARLRHWTGHPARLVIAGLVLLCGAALVLPALSSTGYRVASAPAAPAMVSGPSTGARTSTALTARAADSGPATVAAAPAAATRSAATVHLIRGDTLWALAHRYGTTVAALQALNHLGHATRIYAGTDFHIPPGPAAPAVRSAAPAPTAHRPAVTSGHGDARLRHPVPVTVPATGSVQQAAAGVFGPQYDCAAHLITRESGWNPRATNPASGAYGLAQALPASKMATAGPDWATNPATQLAWMRDYVTTRYGGACAAWGFWQTHHWY